MSEIWILGATGRSGRGIAKALEGRGATLVLVGRDAERLRQAAEKLSCPTRTVVADMEATLAELSRSQANVVVHTVGPFSTTAVQVARALPAGASYVDISNELFGVRDLLALHDEAVAAKKCLVPGAGWGFVGTESVLRKLCEGRPTPERVRVDPVAYLAGDQPEQLGESLAATIVDALAAGVWAYADGKLVRVPAGSGAVKLSLPDGREKVTSVMPTGDLEAAHRATGAPFVVAGSTEAPSGALARVMLPVIGALVSWRPMRRFATRRLAKMTVKPQPPTYPTSWGHARVEWKDGTVREGWLRAGNAMDFYFRCAAEVAARLAEGKGKPGAFTACELFGAELAVDLGGEFQLPA